MKIITYPAGAYEANCYIVYNESDNIGFIIDPGGDTMGISEIITKTGILVKFIVLTHGHFDHTGAVNGIKSKFKVPVFMNEKDYNLVSGSDRVHSKFVPPSDAIAIDKFLNDGNIIDFGSNNLEVIETPGHTPGGITIRVDNALFSGDTLFFNSIGRTDFPGGSYEQIICSVRQRLFAFPDDTAVYPGHGPSTTIGIEKKCNPFFR